jgi:hypothetical protein
MVGRSTDYDELAMRGSPDEQSFTTFYLSGDG